MPSGTYEIELRFLIEATGWPRSLNPLTITQGYLSLDPSRSVRVRAIDDGDAFLTVKGPTEGAKKQEFEYAIPVADASSLLQLCEFRIVKLRHAIPIGSLIWEIDEFLDQNAGLVVAEVELRQESEAERVRHDRPEWAGPELTGAHEYSNLSLSQHPYADWTPEERKLRLASS